LLPKGRRVGRDHLIDLVVHSGKQRRVDDVADDDAPAEAQPTDLILADHVPNVPITQKADRRTLWPKSSAARPLLLHRPAETW
jgi:hypothetical protein